MQTEQNHMTSEKQAFEIVTGKKSDGKIIYSLPAGKALTFPDTSYYVLKLWAFYNNTYYLVKNRDDQMRYTVFARKVEDKTGVRFQNPIGNGFVSSELPDYLEIRFRFPRQSVYMGLYPVES